MSDSEPVHPVGTSAPEAAQPLDESADREIRRIGGVRLLGLVARASLSAFEQLALASGQAEDLGESLLYARLAAGQFDQMNQVEAALASEGVTPEDAMRPFSAALDTFERATAPTIWAERLLKLHLTRGLASDFGALVRKAMPSSEVTKLASTPPSRLLTTQADARLRTALATVPDELGRVSLFGRRVLGEALGQAQWVAAREVELSAVLTGVSGDSSLDLERISDMMREVAARHDARMEALGLFT